MFEKLTLKFDGRYYERDLNSLELANPSNPSDAEIREAAISMIEQETGSRPNLSSFMIERFNSILNMRPSAEYGN